MKATRSSLEQDDVIMAKGLINKDKDIMIF
jgi:hypothetical protein